MSVETVPSIDKPTIDFITEEWCKLVGEDQIFAYICPKIRAMNLYTPVTSSEKYSDEVKRNIIVTGRRAFVRKLEELRAELNEYDLNHEHY